MKPFKPRDPPSWEEIKAEYSELWLEMRQNRFALLLMLGFFVWIGLMVYFVIYLFNIPEPPKVAGLPAADAPLRVQIDPATGCQYLESRSGVTPRLDAAGRQIGCHPSSKVFPSHD